MKPSFNITRITWHEVADVTDIAPIHEALNTYLDLSKYGSGVKQICFIYVAVQPSNTLHPNDARYIKESKTLELQLGLSYPGVVQSTKAEVLSMMATLFLISIDLYPELHIPDFDTSTFRYDVAQLFDSKGWLRPVANR